MCNSHIKQIEISQLSARVIIHTLLFKTVFIIILSRIGLPCSIEYCMDALGKMGSLGQSYGGMWGVELGKFYIMRIYSDSGVVLHH